MYKVIFFKYFRNKLKQVYFLIILQEHIRSINEYFDVYIKPTLLLLFLFKYSIKVVYLTFSLIRDFIRRIYKREPGTALNVRIFSKTNCKIVDNL